MLSFLLTFIFVWAKIRAHRLLFWPRYHQRSKDFVDEHDYEDGEEEEATVGGSEGRHEDIQDMASEADETLQEYDENNDGFIHYGEFYRNHKKMLDAQNQ